MSKHAAHLAAGCASYGGFRYTSETEAATIGPLHLRVTEEKRINIPLWVGLAVVGAGVLLLVTGVRKP